MGKSLFSSKTKALQQILHNCSHITYSSFGHNFKCKTSPVNIKKYLDIYTKKIKYKVFLTKSENKVSRINSKNTVIEDIKVYTSYKKIKIAFIKCKLIVDYINIFLKKSKIVKEMTFYITLPNKFIGSSISARIKNIEIQKINSKYLLSSVTINFFQV